MKDRVLWSRIFVTVAIVALLAFSIHKGWIAKDVKIDQAITQLVIAALGVITTWVIGHKNVVASPTPPTSPDLAITNATVKENETTEAQGVSVDQYNYVVRRHNEFVRKYRWAIDDRDKWIEYGRTQLQRADRVRLNSRAFRTAISLALLSMLVTFAVPPAFGVNNDPRIVFVHPAALFIGAFIVAGALTRKIAADAEFAPQVIAWWIGFTGCFASGFITLATCLPYQWKEVIHLSSPVPGLALAYYVIAVRLIALPLAGFIGSYCVAFLTQQARTVAPDASRLSLARVGSH